MTRLIELVIALALVLALFLMVGLLLPSKRTLEHSTETNRRMTIVYDTVNNVRRLKDWNQLIPRNPSELAFSGGEDYSGVGARVDFDSPVPAWGSGSWEITESEAPVGAAGPSKVTYKIEDSSPGSGKRTVFSLSPSGKNDRNVRINQTYEVDYGWNLLGRFQGMYVSRNVGDTMKSSLARLTNLLATVPNFDYRVEGSTLTGLGLVDLPAEDLLFVKAGNVERNNAAILASIEQNQEWIKRVMETNNLETAGPVRIITTDFGVEKYAFDVAQPVRRRSTGSAAATGSDGQNGKPAADTAPVAAGSPLKVSVSGTPVEYIRLEPRKAASASYTGFMAELDAVRNSLRAWAMTNGHEVTERPYESWKSGAEKSFTADGQYDVYWAVKQ